MRTDDWSYHTPIAKKLLSTGEAQLALHNYEDGRKNLEFALIEIQEALEALGDKGSRQ